MGLKSLGAFGQLRDRLGSIQHVPSTVKGCEDSDEEAISDLVEDSDKCTVDKFSHGGGGVQCRGVPKGTDGNVNAMTENSPGQEWEQVACIWGGSSISRGQRG